MTGNRDGRAEDWAGAALEDILSGGWPNVRGFSWRSERWDNDGNAAHDTTMRVQDNPALGRVFRDILKQHAPDLATLEAKPEGQR